MIITFLYFFIVVFIAFYVPGNVLLKKFKFDNLTNVVFSTTLGIVLWALQGFAFGFIGLRQLSYVYLLVFGLIWLKISFIDNKVKLPKLNLSRNDIPIITLLVGGVLIQLLFTFLNGTNLNNGIYFCCGLPDSLYHIGLTSSLVNSFPPYEPAVSGVIVKNYHYLSNLVTGDLIRVFHLPLLQTSYQYITLLITVLMGLSVVVLGKILKLGRIFTFFLLLFIFYGGDITFLLSYLAGNGLNFHTPFLYDATNLWYSPPRAFGVLLTFVGIGLLVQWFRENTYYISFLLALIFGSLVGFKIYNGFFVFVGLFFVSLYFLIKKDYKKLLLPMLTLIIALAIYLPVNNQASGFYFTGFWRVENFIAQPNLGLIHMELARQIYVAHNSILRIIEYEAIYTLFYFVFVFGTLNMAWFQNKNSLKLFPKELNIFLIPSIFTSLIIGFFFFQKVAGSNTSQFLITSELVMSLYAALACTVIFKRLGKFKYIFLALIILLTVPRAFDQTHAQYLNITNKNGLFINKSELDALNFLKNKTPQSSLIFTDNSRVRDEKQCYYIGFISERKMFLCDAEGIVRDHGVDVSHREKDYKIISRNLSDTQTADLLRSNKIDYIYTVSDSALFPEDTNHLKTVFVNDKIRIIKVSR